MKIVATLIAAAGLGLLGATTALAEPGGDCQWGKTQQQTTQLPPPAPTAGS
jgi:hypothetical protein